MVEAPAENHEVFGRFLVDEGVDLIHGHSAHVFQGIEVHDGAPICYDMGDFVDAVVVDPDLHNDRSFLFVVHVEDGAITRLRLRPVEIRDCAVHPAPEDVAAWCRETMRERTASYGTDFERADDDLLLEL
jgi:poly-gamma-glutamate synthesis protein (capsule biosynthesis protein)